MLVDVDFGPSTLLHYDLQCIASSFEQLGSGLVVSEVSVSLVKIYITLVRFSLKIMAFIVPVAVQKYQ